MIQNCHIKNTLLSGHPFFLRDRLVAIIEEIQSNKVCNKDTELTDFSFLPRIN